MIAPGASARITVLIAALLFSTGGAGIKATSFSGWQVAGIRSGFAALAIALLLPQARASWTPRIGLIGLTYSAMTISFALSNKLTTAANAIFLQNLAPLFLIVLSPLVLKEHIPRRDLAFLAVMAGGSALFFLGEQPAFTTAPDPRTGNLIAMVSSAAWACVIVILRWAGRHGASSEAGLAVVMSGNATSCLLSLSIAPWPAAASAQDWLICAYLGMFQLGLGYTLLTRAVRHVPAFETSILMLAEPLFSPIWAYLFHGETPSRLALTGGAILLAASIARVALAARSPAPATET